jgi:mRNA-degrading endonuclease toxin of MazEF toxin-antitoxin module
VFAANWDLRIQPQSQKSKRRIENLQSFKVKVHQIRTIDKKRVGRKIANLPRSIMCKIVLALALHLDLIG